VAGPLVEHDQDLGRVRHQRGPAGQPLEPGQGVPEALVPGRKAHKLTRAGRFGHPAQQPVHLGVLAG
jgi:hypothetical protein